jgi:hypothetical protein
MDDELCLQFFLQPQATFHRRYEALRAYFLDGQSIAAVADRFGYRPSSLKSLLCRFRASCGNGGPPPFLSRTDVVAPQVSDAVKIATAPKHPPWPTSAS